MTLAESPTSQRVQPHCPSSRPDLTTVTFTVPASIGAKEADLVAEFLAWVPLPLDRHRDGSFSTVLQLDTGREWRYQYLIDGQQFINDWSADDYAAGSNGTCMSILRT